MSTVPQHIQHYINTLKLPLPDSHKGENGKLLIIGGSNLFHAASAWSLEIASKIVDMVFYSSIPENNELIQEAKKNFWNGVVVPRDDVASYLREADCILIGPGMTRDNETQHLTNQLLKSYPDKKWVVDAGALQMVNPLLLNEHMIVTPHAQEFIRVFGTPASASKVVAQKSAEFGNVTIVVKGVEDVISNGKETVLVKGGNAGMTKGGTGDVLAGLIAGLLCTNDTMTAAVIGSYLNKKAGDELFASVGPFFNSSDLVAKLPETMKSILLAE